MGRFAALGTPLDSVLRLPAWLVRSVGADVLVAGEEARFEWAKRDAVAVLTAREHGRVFDKGAWGS